ncbi:hypothetical protein [Algoriphagus sediminis]|uniref:Septum formation inhibitor Maf n=1 Tax=Algoriphagus sediminis TaxID=3057113 RepID=A0ABT7Y8Z5_9BACT|nr:hypothetical protein [Algoriphagus sediminis]MDN3202709.1 hypothetical protein [Algoriphagus sediminis]
MKKVILSVIVLGLFGCQENKRANIDEEKFGGYWYQNSAEINVYELDQIRYGESRKGEAVMIFVTEDFSRKDQVKLDDPQSNPSDAQKVMKLNKTRSFQTGIYPYETMLSVFTPVYEDKNSPKVVASMTEWCGQSFTQMNWKNGGYRIQQFSYFQSEGDQEVKVNAPSEDELWNLLRLDPELIEEGETELFPGLIYQRFSHINLKKQKAIISKNSVNALTAEMVVDYADIGRKLSIRYQKEFPFEILSWEEEEIGRNGDTLVTKALRKKVRQLDYWNLNSTENNDLAKALSL